jgi:hypothetical protein
MIGLTRLLLFYNDKELPNWRKHLIFNAADSLHIVLQRGMLMIVVIEGKKSRHAKIHSLTLSQRSVTLNGCDTDADAH